MTYVPLKNSVINFGAELDSIFSKNKFVVFLCGPTLSDLSNPGAVLRKLVHDKLTQEGFEVVLGEDDGLENIRNDYSGYTHANELSYIESRCNAVVVIASSVGTFCEIGLFAHINSVRDAKLIDLVLIVDKEYEGKPSYFNYGPVKAVEDFGKVYYADLNNFDCSDLVGRLSRRRNLHFTHGKFS